MLLIVPRTRVEAEKKWFYFKTEKNIFKGLYGPFNNLGQDIFKVLA